MFIRKIADHLAQGHGQLSDKRRRRNDLISAGQGRLLVDVDDLKVVAALQMVVAQCPDVLNGAR